MAFSAYLALGFFAAFAPSVLASCAYGTHLHRRAEAIGAPTFGYIGALGPANWHKLDSENSACAQGTSQSPIDMTSDSFTLRPGSDLNLSIGDVTEGAEFENLGTTVEVIAEGAGTMTVDDVEYTLQQFHFHLPSEHLDNGTSMAMEMHMVWESADEQLAVIGAYIDIASSGAAAGVAEEEARPHITLTAKVPEATGVARGSRPKHARRQVAKREEAERRAAKRFGVERRQSAAGGATVLLETVLGSVDQIPNLGDTVKTAPLIMSEVVDLISAADVQAYSGSLTTPPCSEGVSWFVSTQKMSIEVATFIKAGNVIGFNSRFPQTALGEANALSSPAAAAQDEK